MPLGVTPGGIFIVSRSVKNIKNNLVPELVGLVAGGLVDFPTGHFPTEKGQSA